MTAPQTRTCRGPTCRARIILARHLVGGGWIPLDAEPSSKGRWVLLPDGKTCRPMKADDDPATPRYVAHYGTCADAGHFRAKHR